MTKALSIPFRVDGGRIAETRSPKQIIEQKIINVLTTYPLERLGLPLYGAGVQSLLFDTIDSLVEVDFKTDALSDLSTYITGVTITDMKVKQMDFSEVELTVYYRLPLSGPQSITFTVALPGQLNEESPI